MVNSNNIKLILTVGTVIPTLLALAIGFMMFNQFAESKEENWWVRHTNEVLIKAHTAVKLLVDLETGQREFMLSGEEPYLEPYNIASVQIFELIIALQKKVDDNPAQVARLVSIKQKLDFWLTSVGRPGIELRREHDRGKETYSSVSDLIHSETGRHQIAQLREILSAFIVVEEGLIKERNKKAHAEVIQTEIVTGTGITIIIISTLLIGFFSSRIILRQDWVKSIRAKILSNLQGVDDLNVFAGTLLEILTTSTSVHVGSIHVLTNARSGEEPRLTLVGNFGIEDSDLRPETHIGNAGVALTTQCLLAERPIRISSVPDNYFQIRSSLGSAKPRELVLYPIIFERDVIGVIELATFKPLIKKEEMLLETLTDELGSIVNTIIVRNQTEELLKAISTSEARSTAIISSSFDGVLTMDSGGNIQSFSPSAEKMFAYRKSDVIGKNIGKLMPEPYKSEYNNFVRQGTSSDGEQLIGNKREVLGRRSDGTIFPIRLAISRVEVEGANLYAGSVTDITEEKRAQEEIERKSKEADAERKKADEANRMKSEFLANMSHEVRTPMNGIIGMTEILLESELNNQQRKYANTVIDSADALLAIVNDILDFSKIESGKMDLELLPFDLMELAETAVEMHSVRTREKSIELILRYVPGTQRHFLGDAGRLRQIVNNLVGNAIKFTQEGFVVLQIDSVNNSDLDAGKQHIRIAVQDTGIGIPKDVQTKIFEKFSQADSTTTRKFGGTGLGLAISQELAQLMDGCIEVESVEGQGSTFTLNVHLVVDKAAQNELPTPGNLQGLRVLIADKISTIRELIAERLIPLGVDCILEDDPSKTLERLEDAARQQAKIDMVIVDYDLEDFKGKSLAHLVRQRPELSNTALILHSALNFIHGSDSRTELGFNGYLAKPLKSSELLNLLSKVWENYSQGLSDFVVNIDDLVTPSSHGSRASETLFSGPRILLADNDRVNQDLTSKILEQAGCEVEVVDNGKLATQRAQAQNYDLIFMDCEMPEMDGFEASRIITEHFHLNSLKPAPIIALTGNAMQGARKRCLAAGMSDYLSKPYRKKQIIALLATWLPDFVVSEKINDVEYFGGYKTCLVEDNPVNAAITKRMLKELGFEVAHAENGSEAVELVLSTDFDIILMDCMMPVMDGFNATREIRKLENGGAIKPRPIIALTANAMDGDRESCLEAGMDDYFTKPVRKVSIRQMMLKHLKPFKSKDIKVAKNVEMKSELALDQQLFAEFKLLMGEQFEDTVSKFVEDGGRMLRELQSAHKQHNLQEIVSITHTLKSSSAAVGALKLSELATHMETESRTQLARKQKHSTIPAELIVRLQDMFNAVEQQIQLHVHSGQTANPVSSPQLSDRLN